MMMMMVMRIGGHNWGHVAGNIVSPILVVDDNSWWWPMTLIKLTLVLDVAVKATCWPYCWEAAVQPLLAWKIDDDNDDEDDEDDDEMFLLFI